MYNLRILHTCSNLHFIQPLCFQYAVGAFNNRIIRLVGINHVGIGSDFDGDDSERLPGCRASNELINLTVELLRQGYTPEELAKLWGDNLLRVLNTQQ